MLWWLWLSFFSTPEARSRAVLYGLGFFVAMMIYEAVAEMLLGH